MKDKFVKIENGDNLLRDMGSHAVINTDTQELQKVLSKRAKMKQDAEDLKNLKQDVEDIKDMLHKILEKNEK